MGNYLNPSLKGVHLKLIDQFQDTKNDMEEKMNEWKTEQSENEIEVEEESVEPPRKMSPTEILKKKMRKEEEERRGIRITIRHSSIFSNTARDTSTEFKKECLIYESLPDAATDVDQLEWWKSHKEQFPLLSYLVRVVFAVPVASSKSERVFSVAGNMVSPKRSRLSTESMESLVVIKTNLGILREMGVRK